MAQRSRWLALLLVPALWGAALPSSTAGAGLCFPEGFVWGTATAAVQVEGHTVDSDWAEFETRPHAIADGQRIGEAARHWDLYEQDFEAAARMHTTGYRMSLEWSRLEPRRGHWDYAAQAHYRAMLTSLRARGIRPMITLHHFSNPAWVAANGGWANAATADDFAAFARRSARAFGDLVDDWITFNEPTIAVGSGYVSGVFPPGRTGELGFAPTVLGHMARGHWLAYRAVHEADRVAATPGRPSARVGVAEHMIAFSPLAPWNPLDCWWTGVTEGFVNFNFLDAARSGRARFDTGIGRYWRDEPAFAGSLDFVGVNYYTRWRVSCLSPMARAGDPGAEVTDLGLDVCPEGMFDVLTRAHDRYHLPVIVTETGVADAKRAATPRFMVRYLAQVQRAIAQGVPVEGVYWWSLLDNFEWQNGYHGRFGLLAVDFDDPARPRTWTPGAYTYSAIAKANALTPALLATYGDRPREARGPGPASAIEAGR